MGSGKRGCLRASPGVLGDHHTFAPSFTQFDHPEGRIYSCLFSPPVLVSILQPGESSRRWYHCTSLLHSACPVSRVLRGFTNALRSNTMASLHCLNTRGAPPWVTAPAVPSAEGAFQDTHAALSLFLQKNPSSQQSLPYPPSWKLLPLPAFPSPPGL